MQDIVVHKRCNCFLRVMVLLVLGSNGEGMLTNLSHNPTPRKERKRTALQGEYIIDSEQGSHVLSFTPTFRQLLPLLAR